MKKPSGARSKQFRMNLTVDEYLKLKKESDATGIPMTRLILQRVFPIHPGGRNSQ